MSGAKEVEGLNLVICSFFCRLKKGKERIKAIDGAQKEPIHYGVATLKNNINFELVVGRAGGGYVLASCTLDKFHDY